MPGRKRGLLWRYLKVPPKTYIFMDNIFLWNCRGASASHTVNYLVDPLKLHKPTMVAILEPKVHSDKARRIIERSHLMDMVVVEAVGFARGIWLLWDKSYLTVELISTNDQVLNVGVKEGSHPFWILSVIYASPNPLLLMKLWQYLHAMGKIIYVSWLIIGDFNQSLDT